MRLHSNKEVIQYWRKNIRSKNDGSSEVPRKTDLTWWRYDHLTCYHQGHTDKRWEPLTPYHQGHTDKRWEPLTQDHLKLRLDRKTRNFRSPKQQISMLIGLIVTKNLLVTPGFVGPRDGFITNFIIIYRFTYRSL